MPTTRKIPAIEINSPAVWNLLGSIDPHFKDLSYDFNVGNFVIFDWDGSRWLIMTPQMVAEEFKHIEPYDKLKVKFVHLVK